MVSGILLQQHIQRRAKGRRVAPLPEHGDASKKESSRHVWTDCRRWCDTVRTWNSKLTSPLMSLIVCFRSPPQPQTTSSTCDRPLATNSPEDQLGASRADCKACTDPVERTSSFEEPQKLRVTGWADKEPPSPSKIQQTPEPLARSKALGNKIVTESLRRAAIAEGKRLDTSNAASVASSLPTESPRSRMTADICLPVAQLNLPDHIPELPMRSRSQGHREAPGSARDNTTEDCGKPIPSRRAMFSASSLPTQSPRRSMSSEKCLPLALQDLQDSPPTSIESSASSPPKSPTDVGVGLPSLWSSHMQCSSCGSVVQPNHKFCTHCGAKHREVPPPSSALLPPPSLRAPAREQPSTPVARQIATGSSTPVALHPSGSPRGSTTPPAVATDRQRLAASSSPAHQQRHNGLPWPALAPRATSQGRIAHSSNSAAARVQQAPSAELRP